MQRTLMPLLRRLAAENVPLRARRDRTLSSYACDLRAERLMLWLLSVMAASLSTLGRTLLSGGILFCQASSEGLQLLLFRSCRRHRQPCQS